MNLRLVGLRAEPGGGCVAEFERHGNSARLVVEFEVEERDGITTAVSTPDIFRDFDGTAEEQRQIVAAVALFCQLAKV